MLGFNGGLIGKKRTVLPAASVPGIWSLQEQNLYNKDKVWPGFYDPYFSSVALLLQPAIGESIVDLSPSPKTLTVNGNVQISAALEYATLLFDGSSDYISIGNNNAFDTNQSFTFEVFFYQLASGNALLFNRRGAGGGWNSTDGNAFSVFIESGVLYASVYTGGTSFASVTITAPSINTMHYLSISYDGSTLQGHLNTSRFGNVSATAAIPTTRNIIEFGAFSSSLGSYDLNGHIRAMRWTTGVARNSGATITVPTLPFPVR